MTRPDDSCLDATQLATVRRHADALLREAGAAGRFPTPIDDLMVAAKVTVVDDEVLDAGRLRSFLRKAKAGLATLKSALSKVLGLFESNDRLVVIDRDAPKPRHPFIKLHEAGHGSLPHQWKVYQLMHDCEKTLDPDISDLFEREANVFASEVLFQGDVFSTEAHGQSFGIGVPMKLAKKFGASQYSTFRRYVSTNPHACCVLVLESPSLDLAGDAQTSVRRMVLSKSFQALFEDPRLYSTVSAPDFLRGVLPRRGRRFKTDEVILIDRNGEEHVCTAETFDTKHQVLVLIQDVGRRTRSGIVL